MYKMLLTLFLRVRTNSTKDGTNMQISTTPKSPMKPVFHSILDSATIRNIRNAVHRVKKVQCLCDFYTIFRYEMHSICLTDETFRTFPATCTTLSTITRRRIAISFLLTEFTAFL